MEWPHLQVGDDAVLNILLLLTQEVEADSVERVGAELVFPKQHLGGAGPQRCGEGFLGCSLKSYGMGSKGSVVLRWWVRVEPQVGGASVLRHSVGGGVREGEWVSYKHTCSISI